MLEKNQHMQFEKINPLYNKLKDRKAHDHPLDAEKAY